MNSKQRETYWLKTERLRRGIEDKYFKQIRASITKQFKKFASDVNKYGVDGARSRLGLELWSSELVKIFERMYKETVITFGNATYRVLKIEANQKADTFGFNRDWTKAVMEFLTNQGFTLVSDITKTTKDKLLSIVDKGVNEGLGVDEIVKIILSDEQLSYSAFRARRIVRTEVMRASNIGAMEGAKAHSFEVDKQWISARDIRTRRIPRNQFDHVALDGIVVDFDETFNSVGKEGEQVEAMQPGDITQPAGFTINCRCAVGFIPKRDANGRLVFKPRGNNIATPTLNQPLPKTTQQTAKPATTTAQAKENIKKIFNSKTNLNIEKVTISKELSINELNKRINVLNDLTSEYNIAPVLEGTSPTNINFKSTKSTYGYIKFYPNGKNIKVANFGDRSDTGVGRTFNEYDRFIRSKSRVDKENLDIATTVHEFAHLMGIREQSNIVGASQSFKSFFNELRALNDGYFKEMVGYSRNNDFFNVNQISLGKYASTNLNEFMAEAFTEYRLSSNPSKYAVLVGKTIDKYFKR